MKRLILTAVAASLLAIPAAYAQNGPASQTVSPQARYGVHQTNRHEVRKDGWRRGERYRDWRRHKAVGDWNRHGLRRPARGQEWIRVGDRYLLISARTGIVLRIVIAR